MSASHVWHSPEYHWERISSTLKGLATVENAQNALLTMVFDSGRSARVACAHDEALPLLEQIGNGKNLTVAVNVREADGTLSISPAYHVFVRGERVTHALVTRLIEDTDASRDETLARLVPLGFHDGVHQREVEVEEPSEVQ